METALENLLTRRSVRSYQKKEVPEDLLQKITKAGEYAPSGMGRQPCVMVVVRDKELLEKISQMNQAVMGGGRRSLLRRAGSNYRLRRQTQRHLSLRRGAHHGKPVKRRPCGRSGFLLDPSGKRGVRDPRGKETKGFLGPG